jgi:hypothetical protein
MSATQVPRSVTARRTFIVRDSAGNPINVDGSPALPTVSEIQLNGAPTAVITATVAQLLSDGSPQTPVTGYYEVSFSTSYSGVATGDHIAIRFTAQVGGNTVEGVAEFIIDQQSERTPFIDVS